MKEPIITQKEALKIINSADGAILLPLDLGKSLSEVQKKDGFAIIGENRVLLAELEKLDEDACYIIRDNKLQKLAFFSDETNFYYKLVPTADWPTVTLSSTPMHRHTLISPRQDTMLKIREISHVRGRVLDTCCGLGYTAIVSSWKADEVCTFEIDKNMLEMAKLNPYSEELFSSSKIKIFEDDVFEGITKFEDCYFDRIVHDPPTFKYSPLLYSKKFYLELSRVLKNNGILYHYAPNPQKMKGNVFYKKIISNLKECGFRNARHNEASSGVRAVK